MSDGPTEPNLFQQIKEGQRMNASINIFSNWLENLPEDERDPLMDFLSESPTIVALDDSEIGPAVAAAVSNSLDCVNIVTAEKSRIRIFQMSRCGVTCRGDDNMVDLQMSSSCGMLFDYTELSENKKCHLRVVDIGPEYDLVLIRAVYRDTDDA